MKADGVLCARPFYTTFSALHEQRGEDRNQGNDRCALNDGDGGGHILGNGIHFVFLLRMNNIYCDTNTITEILESQEENRIKIRNIADL